MNLSSENGSPANLAVYLMTAMTGWAVDNWSEALIVLFGAVHCYIAWSKHRREKEVHDLEMKQ